MSPPPYAAQTIALLERATQSVNQGRAADAVASLLQAASLNPADAAIRHDLGFVCLQTGRLAEAVAAFQAALALNPRFALASLRLGIALQARGDEAGAIEAFRRASLLQPSLAEAWYRAGALLQSHGHHADATEAFRRAAAAAPNTSLGRLARARALLADEHDGEAEPVLRELLALDPGHPAATSLLGLLLAESGRLEEALACYERATAASSDMAGSYYDLVRCRRITPDDADLLARMRTAVAAPALLPEPRLKVHLALGKACDDLGRYGEAMAHFDAADALRMGLGSFDPAATETRVDRLIARFDRAAMARSAEDGSNDPMPVLIVGLPRSGTTLVEQILSCHPDVFGAGELPFWSERGALWEQQGYDAGQSFVPETAADYLRLLRTLAPNVSRVTDKMPLNLFWVGLIHLALPRATIIHCRRRAIDTALSIHRTYFNQHVAFPTGGPALVATIRAVERLTDHWRMVLPRERYVDLDYERLVADPKPAIHNLLAACRLPWDSACLHPERNPRIVRTPSKWQVREPIAPASPDAWRRYEPWLGPLAALVPGDANAT